MYFSNSQTMRDLPMPPMPVIDTSRARPSRAVTCSSSLTRRSSSARPANGGSGRTGGTLAPGVPPGGSGGGGLGPAGTTPAAAGAHDLQGLPDGYRLVPALDVDLTARLE